MALSQLQGKKSVEKKVKIRRLMASATASSSSCWGTRPLRNISEGDARQSRSIPLTLLHALPSGLGRPHFKTCRFLGRYTWVRIRSSQSPSVPHLLLCVFNCTDDRGRFHGTHTHRYIARFPLAKYAAFSLYVEDRGTTAGITIQVPGTGIPWYGTTNNIKSTAV